VLYSEQRDTEPCLVELDVSRLVRITDKGLRAVIENQPTLQSLILDECEVGHTYPITE
jgi:hypothetical protein